MAAHTLAPRTVFGLAAVSLLLGISMGLMIYSFHFISDVQTIPYNLKVEGFNTVGININTEKLYFGVIPAGSGAERSMTLTSTSDYPLKATILIRGEHADWIAPEVNNILLSAQESESVKFYADVPADASFGNYSGEVMVVFRRM